MVVAAEAATAMRPSPRHAPYGPMWFSSTSTCPARAGSRRRAASSTRFDGETRVVILMTSASDDAVFGALRAGATGLLLKDTDPDELVAAVRSGARRGAARPGPRAPLVADFLSRPERLRTPEQLEELTAREREVVALVACGMSNEEIAERLVVTRATAKTHVSRALCKLHARDRAQLVVLAYEAGSSGPGGPRRGAGPRPSRHRSPASALRDAGPGAPGAPAARGVTCRRPGEHRRLHRRRRLRRGPEHVALEQSAYRFPPRRRWSPRRARRPGQTEHHDRGPAGDRGFDDPRRRRRLPARAQAWAARPA